MSRTPPRVGPLVFATSTLVLALLLGVTWLRVQYLTSAVTHLQAEVGQLRGSMPGRTQAKAAEPVSPLLLDYELDVPGRGEVFPAMTATKAPEYWPVGTLRVTNVAARPVSQTVAAEIPGWSRKSEQTILLGPGETRQLRIQPELLARALENEEIRRTMLDVKATSSDGTTLFAESRPVLIHGGSEIYWGRRFGNAQIAARWVTPHEPSVLQLVAQSRRFAARGRMAGYNVSGGAAAVEGHVLAQARAVFRGLQRSGVSYVNSLFVMGEHVNDAQRIRLPRETLRLASANCMDLSVVFASAMENLGMQPFLVIVPGHAFVGVRVAPDSGGILYLDLTVLPNGSFDAAIARAQRFLRETPRADVLSVDVAAARALGVYPLPDGPLPPPLTVARAAVTPPVPTAGPTVAAATAGEPSDATALSQ